MGKRQVLSIVVSEVQTRESRIIGLDEAIELDPRIYKKFEYTAGMSRIKFDRQPDSYIAAPVRPENHEMIAHRTLFGR